jgi:hypothetical protein
MALEFSGLTRKYLEELFGTAVELLASAALSPAFPVLFFYPTT